MRPLILITLAAGLAACGEAPVAEPMAEAAAPAVLAARPAGAAALQDVAALRAATAHLQRFSQAAHAGYDQQFPPGCFESDAGAMGFHFLNEGLVGTLDPTRPQLVMYEPQKNGSLRLVGVEFVAPGAATDAPPVLFGQPFRWNAVFELLVLHVWAWQHNPAGMFADWNPTVSCAHAGAVSPTPHH